MKRLNDPIISLSIFLFFTGLYVITASNYVAPYRDAGEMGILLKTLSVAHPPGYPLYTVIGKLFTFIPIGNVFYRVNLVSVLFASGALVFFYSLLRIWLDKGPSLAAVLFFGISNPFFELANVAEMYTLGVFWLAFLLFVVFKMKNPYLAALLMALGLGVRMDMMLLYPLIVLLFWKEGRVRSWPLMGLFFGLGLGIFLFMLIRSLQNPVIDWGNPETLSALFHSLSRKSYASTLDLLSLNYQKGENFLPNLAIYISHLGRNLAWVGFIFLGVGFYSLWKKEKTYFWFFMLSFLIFGPLFLYLANMPPNPHAVAIVEAAFPVIDLFLMVFFAFGVQWVCQKSKFETVTLGFLLILFLLTLMPQKVIASKRNNLFVRDYIENVFRNSPNKSVLIFHEDVQLFSLWQAQLLEKRRLDLSLVAQGLSASPWYWDMLSRWGTTPVPPVSVKSKEGWVEMKKKLGKRSLLVGQETEIKVSPPIKVEPHGFLAEVVFSSDNRTVDTGYLMTELILRRGNYRYGENPDFFSSDLITDYANAFNRLGLWALNRGRYDFSDFYFQQAESLQPDMPRPTTNRGYVSYKQGHIQKAYDFYLRAIRKHRGMLEKANDYNSLPAVLVGVKHELANTHIYAGAAKEKLGDLQQARQHYLQSIQWKPLAQAHYNLAVTYWGRDWKQVVYYLRRALEIDPQMPQAQHYLKLAQSKLS